MIAWIRKVLGLCQHKKWRVVQTIPMCGTLDNGKWGVYRHKYILQCQECGDLKTRKS